MCVCVFSVSVCSVVCNVSVCCVYVRSVSVFSVCVHGVSVCSATLKFTVVFHAYLWS